MPSRNDPCPCGSGKKYKHCHLESDEAARRPARALHVERGGGAVRTRGDLPPAGDIGEQWELVFAPLQISIDDSPAARPVAIVVAAGRLALHVGLESSLGADAAALAGAALRAVDAARDASGREPTRLTLRDAGVADLVRDALAPRGVTVHTSDSLPSADEAARSLRSFMAPGSNPDLPAVSHPETWAGWGLERALVGRLHAAAASYYRAAPWKELSDEEPLFTGAGDPPEWTAVVLGNAGLTFGLALYRDPDDLFAQLDAPDGTVIPQPPGGPVLSLTFGPADDLPLRQKRETLAARWEVAGPSAWPALVAIGTPGGGVTAGDVEALIERLESIPRFVKAHRTELGRKVDTDWPIIWTDPVNGLPVELHGELAAIVPGVFTPPAELAPCGPEGTGARPTATLRAVSPGDRRELARNVEQEYVAHLVKTRSDGSTILRRHRIAARLLTYLYEHQRVPVESLTEYELRQFVYVLCADDDDPNAPTPEGALEALRHFLAFLRNARKVRCPWAAAIVADVPTLEARGQLRPRREDGTDANTTDWSADLEDDLMSRLLLLPVGKEVGIDWPTSATQDKEGVSLLAHRQWLAWRDEVIRAGTTKPGAVHAALLPRLAAWLDAPHKALAGRSPRAALARKRTKRSR